MFHQNNENYPFNQWKSSNIRISLADVRKASTKPIESTHQPKLARSISLDKKKIMNLHPTERDGLITVIPIEQQCSNSSTLKARSGKKPLNLSAPPASSIQEQLSNQLASFRPEVAIDLKSVDLPEELIARMFDHQRDGFAWLYHLHEKKLGGILGDGKLNPLDYSAVTHRCCRRYGIGQNLPND
jgi:SNF2 family DNA or RNA helicase